jgi:prepilin signal peptidase PulO-like enzyme (type II secretory pathway)
LTAAYAACMLLLLGAIAGERARAYDLCTSPWTLSAIVPGLVAVGLSGWLAFEGAGSYATPVLLACVAVSATTDIQTGFVFDRVLLATALVLLPVTMLSGRFLEAASGAILAAGLLLIPYACSRGRGIGLGDVKLAAAIGLGLGVAGAVTALWFAALCGGAVAAALLLSRRVRSDSSIPFAPFLALGASYAALGHS